MGQQPTPNRLTFAENQTQPTDKQLMVTLAGDRGSQVLVGREEQVTAKARKQRLDEPPAPRVVALFERGGDTSKSPFHPLSVRY